MASGETAAFRGSVMRSYVEGLRLQGRFDEVHTRVSPEVRERMTILPTSSDWVSAQLSNDLLGAYLELTGDLEAVRDLARAANRSGVVRIVEPIVRTALRIGGGGPGSIFARLPLVLGRQQRGYTFEWRDAPDGPSGTLVIHTHGVRETPASIASWEGGLANAFELAGVDGEIRSSKCTPKGEGSETTFVARW